MNNQSLTISVPVTDVDGNAINSVSAKKMRRLVVKDILTNRAVMVQYVRTKRYVQVHDLYDSDGNFVDVTETVSKGDPYGVVISQIVDGRLYLGWSLLNKKEDEGKYDRDLGILKAVSRFAPVESYLNNDKVPHDIRKMLGRIVVRNLRYFKGRNV